MIPYIGCLHEDLRSISNNFGQVMDFLAENSRLSFHTRVNLAVAGDMPVSECIDHEDVEKELLSYSRIS